MTEVTSAPRPWVVRQPLRAVRRLRDTEVGQSLVEFSLVLPIFLILLFALVDFGRGFYTWLVITNAAREGARAAAVQSDLATTNAKMYASFCSPYPSNCSLDASASKFHVTYSPPTLQGARGTEASVDISYTFTFVTPIGTILSLIGGSSLATPTISAHSSMRFE